MKFEIKTSLMLERGLLFLFLLYLEWYKEIWGDNLIMLYGTVGMLTGILAFRILNQRSLHLKAMPILLKMYFIYFVYSFTGIFFAKEVSTVLTSLITFFCFIVVCFDSWYISYCIHDHRWIYKILKFVAVICVLQVIISGKPYYNGIYVTTMSDINNPNTLALVLLIGIMSFVINNNIDKLSSFIKTIIMNTILLYGISLTGSRKCLLAGVLAILYWIWFYIKLTHREKNTKRFLISIMVMVIGLGICFSFYSSYFKSMSIYTRLLDLFSEGGVSTRLDLYSEAITYFESSPLFGIGFNQYRQLSSYGFYSHSSYAEILSCSGIIGALIFFIPLLMTLFRYLRLVMQNRPFDEMYRVRMIALLFVCELFLGTGQIFIYDLLHLLVLVLISMEENYYNLNPLIIENGLSV